MKKRKHEISYMNILLCLGVIMIHAESELIGVLPMGSTAYKCVFAVWRMLSCAVPGFFFLSGLKLNLNPKTDWKRFYRRRFTAIVIPYLIWMPVYYYFSWRWNYYPSVGVKDFFTKLIDGTSTAHFYFIVVIIQFYITMPIWKLLVNKLPAWIIIPIAAVITGWSQAWLPVYWENNGIVPFFTNDRLMTNYLLPWIVGCCCGKHYDKMTAVLKKTRFAAYAAFIILAALDVYYAYFVKSTGIIYLWVYYLNTVYCIAAIFAILALCGRISDMKAPGGFLSCLDRSCYYIYLSHLLMLMYARELLDSIGITSTAPRFVIITALVYIVPIAVCMGYTALKGRILNKG